MVLNLQTSQSQWYPIYTNPRAEKQAYKALIQKGIETYLPLHRQLKQWSDRKKWVEEPLIKSYLFVRIKENEQSQVLMTKGVARFLYFSGKITSMPERQIQDLKLLLTSPYELQITENNLQPGEVIIVKSGPLKGLKGEILSYRSQKQFAVKFKNLGYCVIVHMAIASIERFL